MNIFTLFLFRRMCQNLLISAPDAGTRHFWHTSLAKGIDIRKEIKTDKEMDTEKINVEMSADEYAELQKIKQEKGTISILYIDS